MPLKDTVVRMPGYLPTQTQLITNVLQFALHTEGSLPTLISMSPRTWTAYALDCIGGAVKGPIGIPVVMDNEMPDGTVRVHRTVDDYIIIEGYSFQS